MAEQARAQARLTRSLVLRATDLFPRDKASESMDSSLPKRMRHAV